MFFSGNIKAFLKAMGSLVLVAFLAVGLSDTTKVDSELLMNIGFVYVAIKATFYIGLASMKIEALIVENKQKVLNMVTYPFINR